LPRRCPLALVLVFEGTSLSLVMIIRSGVKALPII
jgi:hypothetical protein